MAKQAEHLRPVNLKLASRHQREQAYRKFLMIGAVAFLGLALLVVAGGIYDQYVAKPRRPVATVGGAPIRLDTYQRTVRYQRAYYRSALDNIDARMKALNTTDANQNMLLQYYSQQSQQMQSALMNLGSGALEELIDEQIIRQESARRGLTVSAEELQTAVEQEFGYDRNPPTPAPTQEAAWATATPTVTVPITQTPAPTSTPRPTATPISEADYMASASAFYQRTQQESGFTEQDFRRMIETSLYKEKLDAALAAEAPTSGEQVHARHILVATEEEAQQALARLQAGEAFEALAKELSIDTTNKDQGGDLGWFGRGAMVAPFEEAVFALQPGGVSDIVQTDYGYHIIRLEERDANRPFEGSALEQAQQEAVDAWYADQRSGSSVVRSWDSTMVPADNTKTTTK